MVKLVCPHCGFAREISDERLPQTAVRATCPKCRQSFHLPGWAGERKAVQPTPAEAGPGSGEATPAGSGEELVPAVGERSSLPGVEDLFRRSWQIFRRRLWTYLGIFLLGGLLALIPVVLAGRFHGRLISTLAGNPLLAVPVILVLVLVAILVVTWLSAALLYAVAHEELGMRQALGLGLQRLWAYSWLFGLLGFVIGGGWLLFLVPGVLFTLWFFFAQFVLAAEDLQGMEALLKSREYVRGYAGPVFFRLLVLWLVTSFLSTFFFFLPIIGQFISLLLIPFCMIYHYQIYRDLRQVKGNISYVCSRWAKLKWVGIGALGYLLPPLLLGALLLSHPGVFRHLPAVLPIHMPGATALALDPLRKS